MKKIVFLISALAFCIMSFGQGVSVRLHPPTIKKMYVGSLPKNKDDGNNCHKLKIEIMGGDFGSTGVQTYNIVTRGTFLIKKEIHGGSVGERYSLKVYENQNNFDFVIETTGGFTNIWIQSWVFGDKYDIARMESINIEEYNSNNKIEATSLFSTDVLFSTNKNSIGIGTQDPQSKLDVRGKIIADEIEIKVNKGADFVFSQEYKLPTLLEIENHIKDKKHLPDIPSEKEMKENGVNVNEMQIKLLQKIEELTLYVIEQNKKIEKLEDNNNKQELLIEKLQSKIN